jgi:hypothetical protein
VESSLSDQTIWPSHEQGYSYLNAAIGIDADGSPCGNVARKQRDEPQQNHHACKRQRIVRCDTEQEVCHQPRQCESGAESNGHANEGAIFVP